MILSFSPLHIDMFSQMGSATKGTENLKVSLKEYQQWRREFIIEALRGGSYGASFCKHFEIHDYILQFDSDHERCDEYIRNLYVDKFSA